MSSFFNKLTELIFENSCLICNKTSKDFVVCGNCESDFVERKQNYIKYFQGITVLSWGLYNGQLREGILKLKGGKKELATYFSKKLIEFWIKIPEQIKHKDYVVIPVPSHKKRIKERGFCQSTLIANKFAKSSKKDFSGQFILRTKETKFMNSLQDINERIKNIKNAFKVREQIPKGKDILIIDDILTSGSTMCEVARTIHEKYPEINLVGLTVASGDTYV